MIMLFSKVEAGKEVAVLKVNNDDIDSIPEISREYDSSSLLIPQSLTETVNIPCNDKQQQKKKSGH